MAKPMYRHDFDSMGAALSAASDDKIPPVFARPELSSRRKAFGRVEREWYGCDTFEEGLGLAKSGWIDGRQKMISATERILALSSPSSKPSFSYDVAGSYPIAAMAAAGEAHCMVSPIAVLDRARPIVRLAMVCSNSAMVESSDIINYGAAVLSLIDRLENLDYRCEITLVYSFRPMSDDTSTTMFTICVKEAQDVLDLDRMAFCLAHPGMFRRIVFSLMEKYCRPEYEHGYGVPKTPGKKDMEGFILIPSAQAFQGQLKTPEAALGAVMPTLTEALEGGLDKLPDIFASKTA